MGVPLPFHCHGIRKRVWHTGKTGCWSVASRQVLPPSTETSTRRIVPRPDHASPVISLNPGSMDMPPDGDVMTDLASISNENCAALPSGRMSVYFDVSSRVMNGASEISKRRSHLMFMLPSY